MDELAEKVGLDPLEFRARNIYRPGSTTPTGQEPEVYLFPDMVEKLCLRGSRRCPEMGRPSRRDPSTPSVPLTEAE